MHPKLIGRFMAKHVRGGISECWPWLGAKRSNGYGHVRNVAEYPDTVCAHRLSYELYVEDIPAQHVVDHLCRNPSCVNPAHLEAVTYAENSRRGKMSRYWPTCVKRGHPWTPETLLWNAGSPTCRECRRITSARANAKRKALRALATA